MKRFYIILIISLCSNSVWAQYDQIGHDFGNGLRRVKKGNYYGFIDANGKEVIPVKYIYLDEFAKGRTRIVAGFDEVKSEYERNRKYGMIDKNGKIVIPFKYDFIGYDYGNGLRKVTIRNAFKTEYGTDDLSGFINDNGQEVIPLRYRILDDFSDGRKVVYAEIPGDVDEKGSYGYLINEDGTHAFPYKIDNSIGDKGLYIIRNGNGLKGLVDSRIPQILIKPSYWFISYPRDGMIRVATDYGKCGFIDGKKYNMVIQPQYDNTGDFSEGLAAVAKNDKVGFINKKGEVVIPFIYDDNNPNLYTFAYGLCAVSKADNKYAIINNKGEELTPYIYGYIYDTFSPLGFEANVLNQKGVIHYFDHNGIKYETKKERDIAQFEIMKNRASNGDERYFAALAKIYSDDAKCRELGMAGKNDKMAFQWYLKAAESKDISFYSEYEVLESEIYYQIGYFYEEGIGTQKNLVKAKQWYTKSSKYNVGSYLGKSLYAQLRLDELGRDTDINPSPNPSPSYNYATITWQDFHNIITQKQYQLKLGIKSDSKIENVTITVNGIQDRGIKTVKNSDHDLSINHILTLNEGTNNINVSVRNAAGTTQEEKTINFCPHGRDLPVIDWLDYVSNSSVPDYQLKFGIKSKSKIEDVSITINGTQTRGVKTMESDEYEMMVDRTITLEEGTNRIVVSVRNAEGLTTSEKVITYNGITPKPVIKEKRIALVIGNSQYEGNVNSLTNPYNDATDISEKLKKLGFETTVVYDGTKKEMNNAVSLFVEKARNYDVALFYYAGHGLQLQTDIGGTNYLIPVDAQLVYKCDAEDCVSANRIVAQLEASGCNIRLIILDACRDLPNLKECQRGSSNGGFSEISSTVGTYIMYSTREGKTAEDGKGHNSPFAEGILKFIEEKDLPVETFFKKVGEWVDEKTGFRQSPWPSGRIRGNFYFNKQ